MNKKNSYIAAAALVITGTAGVAGWLAVDAERKTAEASAQTALAAPGVTETEALLPPASSLPEIAAGEADSPAPAFIGGRVPAVRTSRTPIASARNAQDRPAAEPAHGERANHEPVNREPVNPRTEPVEPEERVEPVEPAAPPVRFRELTIPVNAVIGVRLNTTLSSDTAEVEDRVEATVTRDVIVEGDVAIPAGTKVLGSVNEVTRGGKFKERARLSVRFHTLVLADGTRETVRVDSIAREGDSPARQSVAKIGGGAVGGAIIGGIMGGRKGAVLGGAAGAGAGTAAVVAGDRSVATLVAGTPLSVRLDAPVTIERER
ncbi:MAG: TrbI/VirB10 family protein [Vicinamibacterales bacterium]